MNKIIGKVLGEKYDELWKAVIRPTRDEYSLDELGKTSFIHHKKHFKRTDLTLTNKRNLKLACSFWEPVDEERKFPKLPCVVYLHGNASSRTEIFPELYYLLSSDITVFAFDFSGCGKSEGEYISLGWYERDDVECVINYLRSTNKVATIGLWGRSMGAVTAIMYGDRDPSIAGLVLDSPFFSLKVLTEELAKERAASIPNFILTKGVKMIRETIKEKANFDINDIEPKVFAERCFIPALFCHGLNDTFVNVHHCKDLYEVYEGDKRIIYVEGDHNTARPRFFRDSASIFFYNTLQVNFIKEISDNYKGFKFLIKNNEIEESKSNKSDKDKENKNKENNENNINDLYNFENNEQFSSFNDEMDEELMFQKILELSKKEYEQQKNNSKNDENNFLIFEKKDKKEEENPNDINNSNFSNKKK